MVGGETVVDHVGKFYCQYSSGYSNIYLEVKGFAFGRGQTGGEISPLYWNDLQSLSGSSLHHTLNAVGATLSSSSVDKLRDTARITLLSNYIFEN